MNNHSCSGTTLNTAIAALVGVATAAVVKLLLDESPEAVQGSSYSMLGNDLEHRAMVRRAKLQELAEAAHDPMYLADMQEVNDDFAFVDAENI